VTALSGLAACLVLAGCASGLSHRAGLDLVAANAGLSRPDLDRERRALQALQAASQAEPDHPRYRIDELMQRERLLTLLHAQGERQRTEGAWAAAVATYREVIALDGASARAIDGLVAADAGQRAAERRQAAATPPPKPPLPRPVAAALARLPQLDPAVMAQRVTVRLRDVPLRLALDTLARSTGLKFIPDKDVRAELRSTLFVEEARVDEVLDLLLTTQQLRMRPVDASTVLIYPDTPAKQREYGELQVRTWAVQHTDVAAMATLLKAVLKSQSVVSDVRGNTLVLRDTPETLDLAEQLLAANDRPVGDVRIDVQIVEVSRQKLSKLGLDWPDALTLSTPASVATLGALRGLGRDGWNFTPLALGLNLQLQDIDGSVIAQPSVRARHKEKARILVGDKVPTITTTVANTGGGGGTGGAIGGSAAGSTTGNTGNAGNAGNTAGQAVNTGGSGDLLLTGTVQYIDVGLKLEVEPQIHGDREVGLTLDLELSRITQTIATASGVAYQIGTRQARTTMRLRDGETQWLGGLISQQDRISTSGLPGLARLPLVGRLFGVENADRNDTELLLSITPHIVRDAGDLTATNAEFNSGFEGRVRARPLGVSAAGEADVRLPDIDPSASRATALPREAPPQGINPAMPGVPNVLPRPVRGARPLPSTVVPLPAQGDDAPR
jgi:general secretion pathway protein D